MVIDKRQYVPSGQFVDVMLDDSGLLIAFPADCGFDQAIHNSVKIGRFADESGPIVSDYRAIVHRQRQAEEGAKADSHAAAAQFRRMLKGLSEEKQAEYKLASDCIANMVKLSGKPLGVCREAAIAVGFNADVVNGVVLPVAE